MQILSTARCLRRIEKTASLQPSLHPLSSSYLSLERATYLLPHGLFYLFSRSPPPSRSYSLASFSRGNHPGDRAETHRNYCPTKLINYAGMDRGAEERAFFRSHLLPALLSHSLFSSRLSSPYIWPVTSDLLSSVFFLQSGPVLPLL